MDIYSFFNSADVVEHCKSIGHEFDALEAAVMVSKSNTRSLEEKLSAYRAIIAEYQDMEIPYACHHESVGSFHEALGSVIAYNERVLEKYLMPEPGMIYQVINTISDDYWSEEVVDVFSSHEEALRCVMELSSARFSDKDKSRIKTMKINLDRSGFIEAKISPNGALVELDQWGLVDAETKVEMYLLDRQIYVPTPFKVGDLVEDDGYYAWVEKMYVLRSIDYIDYDTRHEKCGGASSMGAEVYCVSEGAIGRERTQFYPDLRYCRRELVGESRILEYISKHMQDGLCIAELLLLYKLFSMESEVEKMKKRLFGQVTYIDAAYEELDI